MKALEKAGQLPANVGHDEVQVCGHGAEGMQLYTVPTRRDGEEIENDLGHETVRAEEHVSEDDPAGDEVGGSGEDLARQAHAGGHNQIPCQMAGVDGHE